MPQESLQVSSSFENLLRGTKNFILHFVKRITFKLLQKYKFLWPHFEQQNRFQQMFMQQQLHFQDVLRAMEKKAD